MNVAKRTTIGSLALLVLMASGCATNEKQRITMLEQLNRNLTDRLNASQGNFDAVQRDRDELNSRLLAAIDEVKQLRLALQDRPVAEEAAPGWTAVPGGAMIAIEGNVLFAPGKVEIRDEARRALDAITSTIQGQYGDKDILIIGHTDNQPIKKSGWKDNYQLSTERALAVARYLVGHSVSPARVIAGGCGEHRPRTDNNSMSSRAANRRVEIFAIDAIN